MFEIFDFTARRIQTFLDGKIDRFITENNNKEYIANIFSMDQNVCVPHAKIMSPRLA